MYNANETVSSDKYSQELIHCSRTKNVAFLYNMKSYVTEMADVDWPHKLTMF